MISNRTRHNIEVGLLVGRVLPVVIQCVHSPMVQRLVGLEMTTHLPLYVAYLVNRQLFVIFRARLWAFALRPHV